MELVDIYDNKHQKLNYTKERKSLSEGEYRLSCFAWILNDKNELLIQQRAASCKKFPNIWETVSGGATAGDNALEGIKREIKEELGLSITNDELKFIGSFVRINDFVEVFFINKNIKIEECNLQVEEVQDVKWVSIKEFEKMISDNIACDTGYDIFKKYYERVYSVTS